MRAKKQLENVGFVKTVLMLTIILGHSCNFWRGDWFTKNPAIECYGLRFLSLYVNSFHIYAFTLVSGYLFAFKVIRGGIGTILNSSRIRQKDCLCPMYSPC